MAHPEPGAKGSAEQSGSSGGPDEGEARKIEADGAGSWSLINDDIDPEILHGRIEVFLDDFRKTVNFIDEEDVSFLEPGEKSGQVAGFFDRRTGGGPNGGVHFRTENVGEGGFAESGRAAEEEVVEGLGSGSGGIQEDAEAIFEFGLTGEIGEAGGAERLVDGVAGLGLGIELGGGFGRHRLDLGGNGKV
jgi:hypothetical protein